VPGVAAVAVRTGARTELAAAAKNASSAGVLPTHIRPRGQPPDETISGRISERSAVGEALMSVNWSMGLSPRHDPARSMTIEIAAPTMQKHVAKAVRIFAGRRGREVGGQRIASIKSAGGHGHVRLGNSPKSSGLAKRMAS